MNISDQQFRLGVIAGGVVLVALITQLRFCGSLSLPPKPSAPAGPSGTSTQLLTRSTTSPAVYQGFVERDAANAGVRTPTVDDMAKKLSYRVDEAKHALEPGEPPVDLAGLRLRVERSGDQIVLVIQNLVEQAVAYEVTTTISTGTYACNQASPLPYNAMVIAKGGSERRTECVWREGMAIIVSKVETLEVSPLEAYYLSQLPPTIVGVEDRVARGHRGVESGERCSAVIAQVVRTQLERGGIGWRDLADFYARHRCQTYQFPMSYRAFKSDGEHQLPAVDGSM